MEAIIIALVFASLCHFIYEGTIAPSLRLALRYRLFSLRDELRRMKAVDKPLVSQEIFDELHESLNIAIGLLPFFGIEMIFAVIDALKNNPTLHERVKRKEELFAGCRNSDVLRIRSEIYNTTWRALLINIGGLLVWIVPIAAIVIFLRQIKEAVKSILFMPRHDFERVVPQASYAVDPA